MNTKKKNSTWKQIRLELTGKCNLRCEYCYAADKNTSDRVKDEMSFEDWKKVIEEAQEEGVNYFALIGGEPLLHEDFWRILDLLKDNFVAVTTNATLVNENFVQFLKNYPQLKEFRISLDGTKSHDIVRVGSSYKQVLHAIELIKKNTTCRVVIQTTLNQVNLSEVNDLYSKLEDLKVDKWRINPFQYYSGSRLKKNLSSLEFKNYDELVAEVKHVVERNIKKKSFFDLEIYMFYHSNADTSSYDMTELTDHPCEYRLPMLCVQANGDVVFCPVLDKKFGNVRTNKTLIEAAETKERIEWEYLELKDMKCAGCKYVKICSSGCRERALSIFGDITAPDPVACALVPRVYQSIVPILPEKQRTFFMNWLNLNGGEPLMKGNNLQEMINSYPEADDKIK